MKREIKFRAWCEENKEMYFPDGIYEFWFDNNSIGFYPRYDKDELFHFNTIPSENEKSIIVTQFTGLQDSEGVDIYEGDVLQVDESYINYVIFDKGLFQLKDSIWTLHGVINYNDKIKIIGNIYQNPELL